VTGSAATNPAGVAGVLAWLADGARPARLPQDVLDAL
jgi:hypothetical protein